MRNLHSCSMWMIWSLQVMIRLKRRLQGRSWEPSLKWRNWESLSIFLGLLPIPNKVSLSQWLVFVFKTHRNITFFYFSSGRNEVIQFDKNNTVTCFSTCLRQNVNQLTLWHLLQTCCQRFLSSFLRIGFTKKSTAPFDKHLKTKPIESWDDITACIWTCAINKTPHEQ